MKVYACVGVGLSQSLLVSKLRADRVEDPGGGVVELGTADGRSQPCESCKSVEEGKSNQQHRRTRGWLSKKCL